MQKIDNKIRKYISYINTKQNKFKIDYTFINTSYLKEILTLINFSIDIGFSSIAIEGDASKNIVLKRNALKYINTMLHSKNEYKVRACLDFKVHLLIQMLLYTNGIDYSILREVFGIMKEISSNLVDMNEIQWLFGNNYKTIFSF